MDSKEDASKGGQDWLGTSLQDLYGGQGPWAFATPPVIPSKFHHVLYEIPVTLKEPPQPHYNSKPKHWEDDYVRMPYSSQSLFLVKENDEEHVIPRWDVICKALSQPINNVADLHKAISSYNRKLPRFGALERFFTDVLEEDEAHYFFADLLPKIIQLALSLPELLPGSLPLLKKNHCKSISLSQMQVASLLANGFLCTFLWRKDMGEAYPGVNFIRLFMADAKAKRDSCVGEKLKSIMHYFRRVTTKDPVGVMTFERKFLPRSNMPRWDLLDNNLGNTKIHISSSGTIETGLGFLQVDFANKFVGGGVLGYGCVQEEIRFIICPELIISRLFTEELGDGEALIIAGVERYSDYSGYGDTFTWNGNVNDDTPFDDYGRRKTTVVAIDATRFNKSKDQYHGSTILRELNKAYVGFSCREKTNTSPVATGNWGCGAFKGDPKLKSLIQLMACSASNRDLVYYSFGDTELRDDFYNMHLFLANNRVTICQLWRYLCRFCAAGLTQDKLYSFIQQCHFDMKSQPTLKQFLCFNTQKKESSSRVVPSTSGASETSSSRPSGSKIPSGTSENSIKRERGNKVLSSTSNNSIKKERESRPSGSKISPKKSAKIKSDEIINIIDIMDGNLLKPRESGEDETTLLSEVDKLKKVTPIKLDCSDGRIQETTEVVMEIDEKEESYKSVSFIEDKKRKITDYFSKMTNHVNSYL